MARRRYIQDRVTLELIEVPLDYVPNLPVDAGILWGDRNYANLQATDGADISSRSKHRQYMKEHGLTMAEDFTQHWKRAAEERAKFYRGEDSSRREDVKRAVDKLGG